MSVIEFPRDGVQMASEPRSLDVPVETVLQHAMPWGDKLRQVVVCGVTEDGELYAAGSSNSVGDTILLLERVKQKLLRTFREDTFA